jgi:hypothetical protein
MTGKAMISLTTGLPDPKKMPVTRGRLAVIAAVSALALLAAAGCSSGGSASALARASTAASATPASTASHTYASKYFRPPLTVTVDPSLKSPPVTDFTTFLTWDAVNSPDNKVRFLVPINVYRPGSFVSQAPPKDYLRWLQRLTRHGLKLSNVVKITVDGHPATLMTGTSSAAAGPPGFFAGTIGCPDPANDQVEGCFGIQPDVIARLAVIPLGKTTLLAWARTSKAHPDEAFFAMFERMLHSVRFR